METKHTPGPWKCNPISSRITNNNRSFEIHGFETEHSVRDVLIQEIEPNCKLIAAAPELLEAAINALNAMYKSDCDSESQDKLAEAIKKATE